MRGALVRWAAFLLVPLVVLLLVRNDLNQAGGIDPFIYLAYARDYGDIAARYPGSYYASRLAHLLPNAVAFALFGDQVGYYAVRYLELVLAMAAIHVIARHYANEIVAWLLAIFFCSHVFLLRSFLWDHYEATVVVLALVAIALTLPRPGDNRWAHVAAGFAFAWAINGNPSALVIAAAWFPAWLIERWHQPLRDKLRLILAGLLGATVGQGALFALIMAVTPDGRWELWQITIDVTGLMLAGSGARFFVPLREIVLDRQSYEPLLFAFAVAASAVAVVLAWNGEGERRRQALAALAFASVMTLAFAVLHALSVAVLSLFYYIVYLLPAVLVSLAVLMSHWRPASLRSAIVAAIAFFVVQGVFWAVASSLLSALNAVSLITVVVAGLALLPWLRGRAFAVGMFAVLFASNAFFLEPAFALVYGGESRRALEWDVRNGAAYLQDFVARQAPAPAPVRFWYSPRDPNFNSVQSVHLWGHSRLAGSGPADAQLPALDRGAQERLTGRRHLFIYGSEAEIDAAYKAIQALVPSARIAGRGEFRGREWPGFSVVHVTLR
jgi:hypothetical protein